MLAGPPEPYVSASGFALASATNSFTDVASTEAFTTITSGVIVKRDIGTSSWLSRQQGSGLSASPIALLMIARNSVYPSGPDRTVSRAAIRPFAPGRFSTITGWPNDSARCAPIWRARRSGELPGGEDTRMRIGFVGKDCAAARPASAASRQARSVFFIGGLCGKCKILVYVGALPPAAARRRLRAGRALRPRPAVPADGHRRGDAHQLVVLGHLWNRVLQDRPGGRDG